MKTLKDIQEIISSATSIYVKVANSKEDALNEKAVCTKIFNKYTELSNCYKKMEVAYIYPFRKDDLEVWVIK